MKVELAFNHPKQSILKLTPETASESEQIKLLAERTKVSNGIICRGIQYMSPAVEFLIQEFSCERD